MKKKNLDIMLSLSDNFVCTLILGEFLSYRYKNSDFEKHIDL